MSGEMAIRNSPRHSDGLQSGKAHLEKGLGSACGRYRPNRKTQRVPVSAVAPDDLCRRCPWPTQKKSS